MKEMLINYILLKWLSFKYIYTYICMNIYAYINTHTYVYILKSTIKRRQAVDWGPTVTINFCVVGLACIFYHVCCLLNKSRLIHTWAYQHKVTLCPWVLPLELSVAQAGQRCSYRVSFSPPWLIRCPADTLETNGGSRGGSKLRGGWRLPGEPPGVGG